MLRIEFNKDDDQVTLRMSSGYLTELSLIVDSFYLDYESIDSLVHNIPRERVKEIAQDLSNVFEKMIDGDELNMLKPEM